MYTSYQISGACPCGSTKLFEVCCKHNIFSPDRYVKYELYRELMQLLLKQAINLLDSDEYRAFRESSISQFLLFLDIPETDHESILDNPFYLDMLVEWLLFFAPLAVDIEVLSHNADTSEFSSFIQHIASDESYLEAVTQQIPSLIEVGGEASFFQKNLQFLVEGLATSYLSFFEVQDKYAGLNCLKDCINSELHFTYDNVLEHHELKDGILIGRIVLFNGIKIFHLLNVVNRLNYRRMGLDKYSVLWAKQAIIENNSVSIDTQLNLISALRPLIIE